MAGTKDEPMDPDYYSDGSESSDTPDTTGGEGSPRDDAPESNTALLPKSFFANKELEVGGECSVKIEHVYDDEVEVSYVKHDESSDKPEMESAMDGMDQLATPEE